MAENNRIEFLKDNLRVFVVPVDILEAEGLTTHEKLVYISLRSFANPHKSEAFPSYETIARLSSMSRRHAITCVNRLVEMGYIKKEIRLGVSKNRKIRNTSNLYTLQNPKVVNTVHHTLGSEYSSPPLVNTVHPPSEYSSPEHNHLTNSLRNMIDCSGEIPSTSESLETFSSDLIFKVLNENASICMIEANTSLKDVPTRIDEIYIMLHNQFPNQLAPEIVDRACQLFSERSYDWRLPFRMKIDMQNPVGFFNSCYKDAIKEYKASKRQKGARTNAKL